MNNNELDILGGAMKDVILDGEWAYTFAVINKDKIITGNPNVPSMYEKNLKKLAAAFEKLLLPPTVDILNFNNPGELVNSVDVLSNPILMFSNIFFV